ncbi:sialic acid-binding Ig-like lectin 12 [Pelobates fuscus]|uniref:sialic acid-binding Ig-like lectin 12 n=1 Tax=Pelobates fuscus TaxID=191477 RepID=UPI002FE4D366
MSLRRDCGSRLGMIAILFLLWKGIGCASDADYKLSVPEHVTVQEGLCVTVPCIFTIDRTKTLSPGATGFWSKCTDSNTQYCHDNSEKAFHTTGNVNDGDCSLTIINATKQYAGKYQFRFEDPTDTALKWSFTQRYLHVNITDLTEKPEIIITPQENLVAGKIVTVTCKPPGTEKCPGTAPEITWGKLEKNNKAVSDRDIICGGKNMTISQCKESAITFTLSQDDHRTSITCTVTFPSVKKTPQSLVTLNVQYPPSISVAVENQGKSATNESVSVDNGDSVLLRYSVDSNPPANVTLMRGEERLVSTVNGQELILHLLNIKLRDVGTYTISASNQHGRNNKSVIVHVINATRILDQNCQKGSNDTTFTNQIRDIMIGKRENQKSNTVSLSGNDNINELDNMYMNVHLESMVDPNSSNESRIRGMDRQSAVYSLLSFSNTPSNPEQSYVDHVDTVYSVVYKEQRS